MSKKMKIALISILSVAIIAMSFSAGCSFTTGYVPIKPAPQSDPHQNLDLVNEAFDIISKNYVQPEKIDRGELSEAAVKAMVEALNDPYSSYVDNRTFQMSMGNLQGKYEGIGAYVGMKDGQVTIIAPIPGSPAAKAGIKPGDAVLEVNGTNITGMSLQETVLHILGPKGTSVKLTVLHQGETQPQEIEIVRDEITMQSVRYEMEGDIAHIYIFHFVENTDEELTQALENVINNGATGIILDLRSNPGGLLDEVVDVASHFIKEGVVVSVVYNQGEQTTSSVHDTAVTTNLPMVVLTDNYSASGSEVLAGALQDYGRATIAGMTTYGKGSVNTMYPLSDGSGIYLTIARWYTPKGRLIEGKGIEPDYKLDLAGDNTTQWAIDYLKGEK